MREGTMDTIDLTEVMIKEYLDGAISRWRGHRDSKAFGKLARERRKMAPYYIDAFQCVRASLFGVILPPVGFDISED